MHKIEVACNTLYEHLARNGKPEWLDAMGVAVNLGESRCSPWIIIFTNDLFAAKKNVNRLLINGRYWNGYPVTYRVGVFCPYSQSRTWVHGK